MKHTAAVVSFLVFISPAVFAASGCGQPDTNKSIEAMNEGVELWSNGSLSSAEKEFEKAVNLWSDNHSAYYNLGQVLEQRKKFDEAVDAFQEAVKIRGGDAMYHYRLGRAMVGANKHEKAQKSLEKALELNPKLYKAHYYLGKVYERAEKIKEAADSWTKSAEANPLWGPPFNSLGKLYIIWDKLPEATRVLENGAVNVRGDAELALIYYHLGFAYEQQNNFDKAIENYTESLKFKKGPDALRQRGVSYAAKKDWKKAKKDLDAFLNAGSSSQFDKQAANEMLMKIAAKSYVPPKPEAN